jgi:transcriptional regulator with XRE-family HTH domain
MINIVSVAIIKGGVTMLIIMEVDKIGWLLKTEREKRKLSKSKLAQLSGVSRTYIMLIEQGKRKGRISADMLVKIANALEMSPQPFMEAMGLTYREPAFPENNLLPRPSAIPIYTSFPFHAGSPVEPVEYVYRAEVKTSPKNIEGYIVHGNCLVPVIENNDIIIVDREGQIENGDIVACLIEDELHIARLRRVADEFWLENNHAKYLFKDCKVVAPVIEVIKRLK